jgi:hypothetical protein
VQPGSLPGGFAGVRVVSLTVKGIAKLRERGRYLDEHGLYLQVMSASNRSWLLRYERSRTPWRFRCRGCWIGSNRGDASFRHGSIKSFARMAAFGRRAGVRFHSDIAPQGAEVLVSRRIHYATVGLLGGIGPSVAASTSSGVQFKL